MDPERSSEDRVDLSLRRGPEVVALPALTAQETEPLVETLTTLGPSSNSTVSSLAWAMLPARRCLTSRTGPKPE